MKTEISNHAITLAVMDTEKVAADTRILIGVRKLESNAVHPNVLSVPTERIPACLYGAIAGEVSPTLPLVRCDEHPGASAVGYAVKSVFAQKLGLAYAMELRRIKFSAAARTLFFGRTPVIAESDIEKPWHMLLIAVHLQGYHMIPNETASYADLRPVRVDEFLTAIGDDGFLDREAQYPMGGLCIESTAKWLTETLQGENDDR